MSAVHQPQIVVVGSTMTDMVTYAQRIPERGQTLLADSFVIGFGGKGANQATMARRFGIKVAMVNTLGDDLFGDSTLKNFQSQGINTEFILVSILREFTHESVFSPHLTNKSLLSL